METFRDKLAMVFLILMACSTIANILFYVDVISKEFVQIGFILVMILSAVINILSMGKFKQNEYKIEQEGISTLKKVIAFIILLSWAISYVIAMFLK